MSNTEQDRLIRFRCDCGAVLTARASLSGRKGKCKTCGRVQVIPVVDDDALTEEPPEGAVGIQEMWQRLPDRHRRRRRADHLRRLPLAFSRRVLERELGLLGLRMRERRRPQGRPGYPRGAAWPVADFSAGTSAADAFQAAGGRRRRPLGPLAAWRRCNRHVCGIRHVRRACTIGQRSGDLADRPQQARVRARSTSSLDVDPMRVGNVGRPMCVGRDLVGLASAIRQYEFKRQ